MIGLKRLENIQFCFNEIIKDNIPGDFIETGVWRGGATIFMKALLNDLKIKDRNVWVADSFEGLPPPNETLYPEDKGDLHDAKSDHLAISLETVKYNFQKYDLLDDSVKFLKGWFKDTLPTAPIEKLSIIRLDGDMYESTMDGLVNLYPKLSKGGFIIIDDWGAVEACKKAVIDYRKTNNITEEIKTIDWTGAYWRKSF
ncbi:macrocin O-methyltransferase [Tenacibaculum sp. E3R01]|nr:macrocin O-methyltransferase [Tenacibaculum sp. E3R01]